MPLSESYIEGKCGTFAKENDCLFLKMSPAYFVGIPDRIVLGPKKTIFFIEFKKVKDTTSKARRKRQDFVRKLLTNLGFNVYKIDSFKQFKKILLEELK